MEAYIHKHYKMNSCFMPNISNSEFLKVLDVNSTSVVIEMVNPDCRGVFPIDTFQYWLRRGSLVPLHEEEEKTS